jgi:hypothetical protein
LPLFFVLTLDYFSRLEKIMPEDTRPYHTLYRVYYETSGGAKKERSFRTSESRESFMQSVRADGGKITGTSQEQEREQQEGFSFFR